MVVLLILHHHITFVKGIFETKDEAKKELLSLIRVQNGYPNFRKKFFDTFKIELKDQYILEHYDPIDSYYRNYYEFMNENLKASIVDVEHLPIFYFPNWDNWDMYNLYDVLNSMSNGDTKLYDISDCDEFNYLFV